MKKITKNLYELQNPPVNSKNTSNISIKYSNFHGYSLLDQN